jgi:hypothetical protein
MKIDQEKFPALFTDYIPEKYDQTVHSAYGEILKTAKANLFYVASTVIDNISKSFEKLKPLKNEIQPVIRGTLMKINDTYNSFLYSIDSSEDKITILGQLSYSVNRNNRQIQYTRIFGGFFLKEHEDLLFHSYNYLNTEKGTEHDDYTVREGVKIIVATELFLHFAEIETKELPPSRQIYDGPVCLYNNKTKLKMNVVDCTWFTNLIKSGEFNVRGHFRLQPYADGSRRLIWINDFKKHGYTRKARIETFNQDNQ